LTHRKGGERVNRESNKKLKIYLQKHKIPLEQRNKLWILKDKRGKVFWCEKIGFFHNFSNKKNSKKGYIINLSKQNEKNNN
jgi:tRNA(Ile)-lysidine synthetase-like protein